MMIARASDAIGARIEVSRESQGIDRWIYVFMAGLYFVTVLTGFIPDSIGLLKAVDAGQIPPLPPIYHAHALLMGAWLSLLLAQTTLMATGHGTLHKKLGLVAIVLVPLIALAMPGMVHSAWTRVATIPVTAMAPEALSQLKVLVSNILLVQTRIFVLFPCLIACAFLLRKKDPESHKRLIILATLLPLPAAVDRMTWLPTSIPGSPASIHLYSLLLLLPVLIYDLLRRGRVHRAYVIGVLVNLPFIVATHWLWGSPWWLATAPQIVGVQGW